MTITDAYSCTAMRYSIILVTTTARVVTVLYITGTCCLYSILIELYRKVSYPYCLHNTVQVPVQIVTYLRCIGSCSRAQIEFPPVVTPALALSSSSFFWGGGV
jgi:hypothetical protein